MVVVDQLSKMAHFITLKHPFTVKQVAEKLIEEVVSKHGIPNSIVGSFLVTFRENCLQPWDNIEEEYRILSSNEWPNQTSESLS